VTRLTVSIEIDAPPAAVWRVLEPIEHHTTWMADAIAIRFTTDQHRGVGTRFVCDTRIGPFRVEDHMEVTEWRPEQAMGVRHEGLVTGSGQFTLDAIDRGRRTRFTWSEDLKFPWYLGGPVGGWAASATALQRIWRANLARLRAIVEDRVHRQSQRVAE
jgi:uncharacterized protein YndB with AHSA1/START domain